MTPHKEALILENQNLAMRAAGAFWNKGGRSQELEELQSEALLELVCAVGQWDSRNSRIGPFLVQRINWKLLDWVKMQSGGTNYNCRIKAGTSERIKIVGLTVAVRGTDGEVDRPIPDQRPNPEQALLEQALSPRLDRLIQKAELSKRERNWLILDAAMPTAKLAKKLGFSQQRIYQVLGPVKRRLRELARLFF